MKPILSLIALATVTCGFSQLPMLRRSLLSQRGGISTYPGQAPAQSGSNLSANSSSTVPTETIRLLGMTSVEQKLGMTADEYTELTHLSRSMSAATTSEEQAYSAVSKFLTTSQISLLQTLLVEDLGYGALALSTVRSQLNLSSSQSGQILAILDTLEAAKRTILSMESQARTAVAAVSKIATKANISLAMILTSTQDAQLRLLSTRAVASTP
jgi:hypothetical protein